MTQNNHVEKSLSTAREESHEGFLANRMQLPVNRFLADLRRYVLPLINQLIGAPLEWANKNRSPWIVFSLLTMQLHLCDGNNRSECGTTNRLCRRFHEMLYAFR